MDEDSGQNSNLTEDYDQPESSGSGSSFGEKAQSAKQMGEGLKSAAKSAKDIAGAAKGGAGDGIGSAVKSGLGSLGGAGSSTSNPLSGLSGSNKSMDGIKNSNTSSMFKGMEGGASPINKNDPDSEKNPSASDFSKKAGGKTAGQKAAQAVDDVVKTAKEAKHAAAAIGSLGTDALDDAELAKDLAKAAVHPIKTAKRYGRVSLYVAGFFFIQVLLVMSIIVALFFGIYKVYLVTRDAVTHPWDVTRVATELRITREMGSFLIRAAGQIVYERELEQQKKSGVAVAAPQPPNFPEHQTNPETSSMFEAWDRAGLATKFIDDYHARFERIEGTSGTSLDDWQLVVNNNNFGPISSTRSQAFLSIFAEETTHWSDIYTRKALQGVASDEFNTESFMLDLPDSEGSIANSRENTTRQLVDSTAQPIADRSDSYYTCLIEGLSSCDSLGLGSSGSPDNNPTAESRGWIGSLISSILGFRNQARDKALSNKIGKDNLGNYVLGVSEQVTADTSTYNTKDTLSANIRTGASDTILSSIAKNEDGITPDTDVLLDLYDRFQTATENGNFARVNYDRESQQSVAMSENYFIAGGQLLNNEMGLLDSWALSENLSVIEESSIFRSAVLGHPIGVFAQSDNDRGIRSCQQIYNDFDPVGEVRNNTERDLLRSSCFRRSLIPNLREFQEDKSLNIIYNTLESKNREVDQNGGQFGKLFGPAIPKYQQYVQGEVRTSPVATESISINTDLSPEFDGYINKVYGVARTGAEINGDAYDTLATASEALWSRALIDENYGVGGKYLTDDEFAQISRYAQKLNREKLALKPLSERLFAIKEPDSLVGKLAMLTPTNSKDGVNRTLALLKPSNLTSAIASRMVPLTFAQDTTSVNPLHAVRTGGYTLSDPSNRMDDNELWERYNCGSGGPTQETGQPEGIPFTIPTTTNPCKREMVISKMTTCYFDTEDSCAFDDSSTGSYAITDDTSSTPCYAGSEDLGVRDDAYTQGRQIRIRLCAINGMTSSSEESQSGGVPGANGRALTASIASEGWVKLKQLADQRGIPLSATSTFRTMEHQQRLCNANSLCASGTYTAVAKPGTSNHQSGTAMDIAEAGAGQGASSGRTCTNPQTIGTATYAFLEANARTFGIKHYANESWHWGTNEQC